MKKDTSETEDQDSNRTNTTEQDKKQVVDKKRQWKEQQATVEGGIQGTATETRKKGVYLQIRRCGARVEV